MTLHQPNYLPWIGLFSKISQADCLVISDTVQFTSRGLTHRNRIRTSIGWCYLTIPVSRSLRTARIRDVSMPDSRRWQEKHWRTINTNYARSRFFKHYAAFFQKVYQEDFRYLWQLNERILLFLLDAFQIKVEVIRASDLNLDPDLNGTDLIMGCLKSVGADIYLSGPSGKNYLEAEKFFASGTALRFFEFQHPVYRQRYPGFEPNMSAIDLLFNLGPQSGEIVKRAAVPDRCSGRHPVDITGLLQPKLFTSERTWDV